MSSSWNTGGEAGTPSPAEILVYPIFIRALARSLQLSYREELRRVLAYALLHPLGYWEDTSEVRLRMRLAEERWIVLWKPLSCVSHETSRA
jgi:ssRNA-specific RNase YbeY (16S rRNA maturation enzyme)